MPRTAKRALPVAAPQDQGYGQRGDQMAAQHAIPLPDNRGAGVVPTSSARGVAAAPAPGTSGMDPMQMAQALQQAQQLVPAGGLDRPTERPNEPFTAGLSSGPGPGPQDTGGVDPVLDYLRAVAASGYATDEILSLIERAGG